MGNHAIGRAMVSIATALVERRREGETALDILDMAADRSEIRGTGAEFDGACYEDDMFRDLLIEAFANGEEFDTDDDDEMDAFYDRVIEPFSKRYGLC